VKFGLAFTVHRLHCREPAFWFAGHGIVYVQFRPE